MTERPEPIIITWVVSPEEAAERIAAHAKYGRWMSPREYRVREEAEALGFELTPITPTAPA